MWVIIRVSVGLESWYRNSPCLHANHSATASITVSTIITSTATTTTTTITFISIYLSGCNLTYLQFLLFLIHEIKVSSVEFSFMVSNMMISLGRFSILHNFRNQKLINTPRLQVLRLLHVGKSQRYEFFLSVYSQKLSIRKVTVLKMIAPSHYLFRALRSSRLWSVFVNISAPKHTLTQLQEFSLQFELFSRVG